MGYDKLAHWLSQNYQWIFSGIGVLIVAYIIQRLSSHRESKHEAKSTTTIAGSTLAATGQHNTQSVATQNFHAENIHIGHAVAAPASPQLTKTERTLPNLTYAGAKRKNVFVGPGQHTGICDPVTQEQRDKSVHGLVVKVENRVVPGGRKITSALNVIAKLKFRHKNGATERDIDYGVWLNSPCNSTEIGVGDTRELVLVCELEGIFATFEDKRSDNRDFYSEGFSYIDFIAVPDYDRVDIIVIDQSTQATLSIKLKFWRDGESICTSEL